MSALIRVVLSSESARLQPGEWADLTLTVQNFGETVDRYQVVVEGVPAEWVTVSRGELSLFPKDQDQLRITLLPPAGPQTRAGRYDVRIRVSSQEQPGEETTVPFVLEVEATAALDLALSPTTYRGATAGDFRLQVSNRGNADLTVFLEAMDPASACTYTFEPPQVVVPAGQVQTARLRVSPASQAVQVPQVHPFTVTARPAEAPRLVQQVEGRWEQLPRRRVLWPVLVAVLLGLAGLAAAFYFLLWPRLQDVASVSQAATVTPRAEATTEPVPTAQSTSPPTAAPTAGPTAAPTPVPTVEPSVVPSVTPTPDPRVQIEADLWNYTNVRAEAEKNLDPELLRQVCVDPYLTRKMGLVEQNKVDGVHWETWSVDWTLTSLNLVGPDRAEVGVRKTETKVFFPKGSAVPDDEICSGPIYSYRDCTYDILYIMILKEGHWYVSDFEVTGDCQPKCQQ